MQEIEKIIKKEAPGKEFTSFKSVYKVYDRNHPKRWIWGLLILLSLVLFLPWTQNIRASGTVTTLRQEDRPQQLNSIIAGRIISWNVKEGDYVSKGDTIAQLAEVKAEYLDPNLLERTKEQITAKENTIVAYQQKIAASESQIYALEQSLTLKLSQLENKILQTRLKVISDSMDVQAANNDYNIAAAQYRRQQAMRDSGLVSLVDLEKRNQYLQQSQAKKTNTDIKLANTRTELINTMIELNTARQEYSEKIAKSRGDIAAAQSDRASATGEVSKLTNQYSNYAIRAGQYFLLAPQDGQVIRSAKAGINEQVKEGEMLVEIVPNKVSFAVAMYVRPMDLPLLRKGQEVRFNFDGFPAIVFSGWPEASYGMFTGSVYAIETSADENGKFRVLIAPDQHHRPWPPQLTLGTGAAGIALLEDVPLWYELWRNINGFPPDYYQPEPNKKKNAKN